MVERSTRGQGGGSAKSRSEIGGEVGAENGRNPGRRSGEVEARAQNLTSRVHQHLDSSGSAAPTGRQARVAGPRQHRRRAPADRARGPEN